MLLGSASAQVTLDISQFMANAKTAEGAMTSLASAGGTGTPGFMSRLNQGALALGTALIAPMTLGIVTAAQLEQGLANVDAALGDISDTDLSALADQFNTIAINSKFSSVEIAGVAEQLAKAGVAKEDLSSTTLAVVDLSQATGDNLTSSLTAVTTATAIWADGMVDAEDVITDVTDVADILTGVTNNTRASLDDINAGMRSLAPAAARAGLSYIEAAAAVGFFVDKGLTGADAGVSLTRAMTELADPTSEASATLDALGISAYDAQGSFVGFPTLFDQLQTATAGLTDQQKELVLSTIFGAEAIDVMGIAALTGGDDLRVLEDQASQSGIAAEQSGIRMDTFSAKLGTLKEAVATVLGSFVSGLLPAGKIALDFATTVVEALLKIPGPIKTVIGAIAGLLAGFAAVTRSVQAFRALNGIMGALSGNSATAAVASRGLLRTVLRFVPGLALVSAGFLLWETNAFGVQDRLKSLGKGVKNFATSFTDSFRNLTKDVKGFNIWGGEEGIVTPGMEKLPAFFVALGNAIGGIGGGIPIFEKIGDAVMGFGTNLITLTDVWSRLRAEGLDPFHAGITALTAAFPALQGPLSTVESIMDRLRGTFDGFPDVVLGLKSAFDDLASGNYSGAFTTLGNMAQAALDNLGDAFYAGLQVAWDGIRAIPWETIIPPIVWDNLVGAFEWATVVVDLLWGDYIDSLNWGDYVDENGVDWTLFIGQITWDTYLVAVTWADFITVIAWGTYLTALDWLDFISVLEWNTYLTAITWLDFISPIIWDTYLTSITWLDFISEVIWDTYLGALTWTDFVGQLTWETYLTAITWLDFISPIIWDTYLVALTWTDFVASVLWDTYLAVLTWSDFVAPILWDTYLTAITWTEFIGELTWATYIAAFNWVDFIGVLEWNTYLNLLTWSNYVKSFVWSTYVKVLSWVDFIGNLTWDTYLTVLGWADYVGGLSWGDFVPDIAWSDYIPTMSFPSAGEILAAIIAAIKPNLPFSGGTDEDGKARDDTPRTDPGEVIDPGGMKAPDSQAWIQYGMALDFVAGAAGRAAAGISSIFGGGGRDAAGGGAGADASGLIGSLTAVQTALTGLTTLAATAAVAMNGVIVAIANGITTASLVLTTSVTGMATAMTAGMATITAATNAGMVAVIVAIANGMTTARSVLTSSASGMAASMTTAMALVRGAAASGMAGVIVAVANGMATARAVTASGAASMAASMVAGMAVFRGAVTSGMAGAVAAVRSGVAQMVAAASAGRGMMMSAGLGIGAALGQGIAAGIRGQIGAVAAAAAALVSAAVGAARAAGAISSPSKVMRDEIGYNLSLGVAAGIYDGLPVIYRAGERMIPNVPLPVYGRANGAPYGGSVVAPTINQYITPGPGMDEEMLAERAGERVFQVIALMQEGNR